MNEPNDLNKCIEIEQETSSNDSEKIENSDESRFKGIVSESSSGKDIVIDAKKHPELFVDFFKKDISLTFSDSLDKAFPNNGNYSREEYNALRDEVYKQVLENYDEKLPGFANKYTEIHDFYDKRLDEIKNAQEEIEMATEEDSKIVENKRLSYHEAFNEGSPQGLTSDERALLYDEIHELYDTVKLKENDSCAKSGIDISDETLWKQRVITNDKKNNSASEAVVALLAPESVVSESDEKTEPVNKENQSEEGQLEEASKLGDEEIIKKYFSYNDTLNKPEAEIQIYPNQEKYVESLREIAQKEKFNDTVNKIRDEYEGVMNKLSMDSSIFGASQSWIYWDLAKQDYYSKNPEVDSRYETGDPIEKEDIQYAIVNRHLGWELYGAYNQDISVVDKLNKSDDSFNRIVELLEKSPKEENQTLSSYDLAELGKCIRMNLVSFD